MHIKLFLCKTKPLVGMGIVEVINELNCNLTKNIWQVNGPMPGQWVTYTCLRENEGRVRRFFAFRSVRTYGKCISGLRLGR